jgi:hypothetical protein
MTIKALYPNIIPSLSLDFANVENLDPRITFARASTATYYNGVTTAKAEENLLLQSQDFTTTWVNVNSTDAANTTTAPDGTTTADTLTDDATSGTHSAYQSVSVLANTTYVVSCFLKAGTSNFALLAFTDAGTAQRYFAADFDLSTGTVRTSVAGSSGTITSATITDAGSGWYRCVIIGQTSAVGANRIYVGVSDGTSALGNFGFGLYVGTGSTIEVWGAQLEQRSAVTAYTPTTTQPITNYVPVLLSAADNVARFDHNPVTGESLGLLIEEQRTNLVTYSEAFDNAAWTKTNSSITANTIVAPDGELTADTLQDTSDVSATAHIAQSQSISLTSGTAYTISVYAKAGALPGLAFIFPSTGFTSSLNARFNISTGVVASTDAGITSATITNVGNGWYRCTATATATSTVTGNFQIRTANASTSFYQGTGTGTIYIWGAQLEAGAFPTSYIATVASQVTRSADAASMTGANFSSWYRADEGTLYAEATSGNSTNDSGRIASINDNTSNNRVEVLYSSASQAQAILSSNNVTQASLTETVTKTNSNKTAFAYKVNDTNASFNSSVETTDTSCDVPVVFQINIGARSGNSNPINGTIKKLAYYPKRLANAELQALTQN